MPLIADYKKPVVTVESVTFLIRKLGKHVRRDYRHLRKLVKKIAKKNPSLDIDELLKEADVLFEKLQRIKRLQRHELYKEGLTFDEIVKKLVDNHFLDRLQEKDREAAIKKIKDVADYADETFEDEKRDQRRAANNRIPRVGVIKKILNKPRHIAKEDIKHANMLDYLKGKKQNIYKETLHAFAYIAAKTDNKQSISHNEYNHTVKLLHQLFDTIQEELTLLDDIEEDTVLLEYDEEKLLEKLLKIGNDNIKEKIKEHLVHIKREQEKDLDTDKKLVRTQSRREFISKLGKAAAGVAVLSSVPGQVMAATANPSHAQVAIEQVYDDKYNSNGADERIARKLYPLTLQQAYDQGYIAKDMSDLLMPLGLLGEGTTKIDFVRGMGDMWRHKKGAMWGKDGTEVQGWQINQAKLIHEKRNQFQRKVQHSSHSSLRGYRDREITNALNLMQAMHKKKIMDNKDVSIERKEFMQFIVDNLSPNVLLGYNIQEILPPWYHEKRINPVYKAYFLDRLFKEAGNEFVEGYPARYDYMMSFGPFQLMKDAVKDVQEYNKFLPAGNHIPSLIQDFSSLQQHVNAAALFAYANWEKMATLLYKKGLIKKTTTGLSHIDKTKRQIFIAGITACMHHDPVRVRELTYTYMYKGDFDKIHYLVRERTLSSRGQLQKYYDSAAEAYMLMKVFHVLDERYGRK